MARASIQPTSSKLLPPELKFEVVAGTLVPGTPVAGTLVPGTSVAGTLVPGKPVAGTLVAGAPVVGAGGGGKQNRSGRKPQPQHPWAETRQNRATTTAKEKADAIARPLVCCGECRTPVVNAVFLGPRSKGDPTEAPTSSRLLAEGKNADVWRSGPGAAILCRPFTRRRHRRGRAAAVVGTPS